MPRVTSAPDPEQAEFRVQALAVVRTLTRAQVCAVADHTGIAYPRGATKAAVWRLIEESDADQGVLPGSTLQIALDAGAV